MFDVWAHKTYRNDVGLMFSDMTSHRKGKVLYYKLDIANPLSGHFLLVLTYRADDGIYGAVKASADMEGLNGTVDQVFTNAKELGLEVHEGVILKRDGVYAVTHAGLLGIADRFTVKDYVADLRTNDVKGTVEYEVIAGSFDRRLRGGVITGNGQETYAYMIDCMLFDDSLFKSASDMIRKRVSRMDNWGVVVKSFKEGLGEAGYSLQEGLSQRMRELFETEEE